MKRRLPNVMLMMGLAFFLQLPAQVKFPVTNNDLRNNLEKVISDFPFHFHSLIGDTLGNNPQTIEYASRLDFKTAPDNQFIQYKSAKKVFSWSATLVNSEDFEVAAEKYTWLYNQLKVMTLTFQGVYTYTLHGSIEMPAESRKFSSSIFKLISNSGNLPKIKVEASINFEFPEWKVRLLVYEKEREDNERGEVSGD